MFVFFLFFSCLDFTDSFLKGGKATGGTVDLSKPIGGNIQADLLEDCKKRVQVESFYMKRCLVCILFSSFFI